MISQDQDAGPRKSSEEINKKQSDSITLTPSMTSDYATSSNGYKQLSLMTSRGDKVFFWVFVAYIISLLSFILFRQELWKLSVYSSEVTSALSVQWKYYFYQFSYPLFSWHIGLCGLLLFFARDKSSMLKSLVFVFISDILRNHIRAAVKEERPIFDDNRIVHHLSCSCSFGFPSGHSEGSSMTYATAIYEIVLQNEKFPRRGKVWVVFIGAYIVMNVMLSRVYFGKHTVAQVVVGGLQGTTFFLMSLRFGGRMQTFLGKIFTRDSKVFKTVNLWCTVVFAINTFLWVAFWEPQIRHFDEYSSYRCAKCFDDELLKIRQGTAIGFQYFFIGWGMVTGIYYLSPLQANIIRGPGELLTRRGVFRIILLILAHSPLLSLAFFKKDSHPHFLYFISGVICFITGFIISHAWAFCLKREEEAIRPLVERPPPIDVRKESLVELEMRNQHRENPKNHHEQSPESQNKSPRQPKSPSLQTINKLFGTDVADVERRRRFSSQQGNESPELPKEQKLDSPPEI